MTAVEKYDEIWCVDYEFSQLGGNLPSVICMVAREHKSGRTLRVWMDELNNMDAPPFPIDSKSLFVAYFASAEIACFLELRWPLPVNILDLYCEFRVKTNGLKLPFGKSLLGAMKHYGISGIEAAEKDSMRDLAIRGGPYSENEKSQLLDYCESDVISLARLLSLMAPDIDLPRALLRGRFMKSVAIVERNGVPIDSETYKLLTQNWFDIQLGLIKVIDNKGIYEGFTFKSDRFEKFLVSNNIPWPRLSSGKLDLKDNTFRERAMLFPQIKPIHDLRVTLSQMRLLKIEVGKDSRSRCLLSPFSSITGRNQPSTSKYIFSPAVWLRGLMQSKEGFGIAYIDWKQQEFGIAAALSRDILMKDAYLSGDPYLSFAKQAGAVPASATKQTHSDERSQFKACVLAVQYGMGEQSLADRIGQPILKARELLDLHRKTYKDFWKWSDNALDYALIHNKLWTTFGWPLYIKCNNPNPRSIRNFPMQANGAEMLRIATILCCERDIKVCAPIHDALLIEAPLEVLDDKIQQARDTMEEASKIVLDGFALGTDVEKFCNPDRYMDERGVMMWNKIMELLKKHSYLH